MRNQRIFTGAGELVVASDLALARIELHTDGQQQPTAARLTEGELLMLLEALAEAYGRVCGARADSVARGVSKALRNRTQAARERRAAGARAKAA